MKRGAGVPADLPAASTQITDDGLTVALSILPAPLRAVYYICQSEEALSVTMNYLHYEIDAGPSDVIEVTLDHAANVQLMDFSNYDNYRNGRQFRYYGGYVTTSPYRLSPPSQGHWHLAIDLGGNAGTVRASIRVLKV